MRINDKQFITTDKGDKAADTKKAEGKRGGEAGKSASLKATADSVQLSSRTRDIAEITLQLKEASEVREELVSELRSRIKSGEYHVSGFDIASKIMDKARSSIF
ncbi:MAG: flagellar biosynthesis anti-sigma factor FlgM [Deferribacteraceae bacterium]|jgi:flagellar biosynthesis anti-sigma factor FlgM|nr:flagellar biosynthesis anti-sigma factor FlgM [Deferribacteraceae bacterium]